MCVRVQCLFAWREVGWCGSKDLVLSMGVVKFFHFLSFSKFRALVRFYPDYLLWSERYPVFFDPNRTSTFDTSLRRVLIYKYSADTLLLCSWILSITKSAWRPYVLWWTPVGSHKSHSVTCNSVATSCFPHDIHVPRGKRYLSSNFCECSENHRRVRYMWLCCIVWLCCVMAVC